MKLIVGLGNPGKEYKDTRHNMGFYYLDEFANKKNVSVSKNKKNGLYETLLINGEKVILLKPQSYINLSGNVVRDFVNYFDIKTEDILIISDDLDTEMGRYRLRSQGTSGGHNGLKSIEESLGTTEYKRLKVGISNNKYLDTKDYVLGKLNKEENEKIKENISIINDILEDFAIIDFDKMMAKYNKK